MSNSAAAPDARLRVAIIDAHEVALHGVRAIAEDAGFTVVGASTVVADVESLIEEHAPGVIVCDPASPGEFAALRGAVAAAAAPPKMLVLTHAAAPADLYGYLAAGVTGCLMKDCSAADLVSALRLVAEGQTVVAPQLAAALVTEMSQESKRAGNGAGLTERELEVLGEIAQGLTNRDIARKLALAENTVKNHVRNILDKLGLRSRVEATLYAIKSGLVDPRR